LPVIGSVDLVPTVTPALTPYLTIANPNNNSTDTNDDFGLHAITADSDYIVVGARLEDDNGTSNTGIAYVFDVSNGNLVYTLENPQATSTDYYGFDVALTANYIVVGANQEEGANFSDGAIYIYSKSDGLLDHTIEAPAASGNSYFGTNIDAIDYANDKVAVAAPGESKVYWNVECSTGTINAGNSITNPNLFKPQISNPGNVFDAYNGWFIAGEATNYQAHIYQGSTLRYTLNETDVSTDTPGRFGSAVAISNSYYAVAGFSTNNGDGRVWVGQLSDGAILGEIDWPANVGQDPSDGNNIFGYNLQLTDDYLYITTKTVFNPPVEGRVWVYDPATQIAIPQKKIYPPDSLLTGSDPEFGQTIGSDRDTILVAHGKDGDGNAFVYAYDIT